MSITSYAQNFEDVMLWRALQHVQNGCYIDIGAQDPLVDSVSLAFHQQGWYGVHVEPTSHYAELLRQQRPGDTVVQAAVGSGPGLLRFFEISDTGISTADPVIADEHRARGFAVHEITVPCITLAAVFEAVAGRDIHWLKVDVEGFEQQVLASWAPSSARPWIVVVESTRPLTQIESYDTWEPLLIGYGYTPVYFDGLNRYYIADAHPELKDAFHSPPNVFDGFCLNGTASTPFHALIASRHQEQLGAVQAQAVLQKESADQDIARLTQSISALDQARIAQQQIHSQQLQAMQQALQQRQQEHAQREQLLLDKNGQARLEQQTLLRTVAQREQEVSTQLLTHQLQAAQELAALASGHHAQEQALQHQHREREHVLHQQLSAVQQALQDQQQDRIQREQQVAERLLAFQVAAAEEKAALVRDHLEQERALHSQHAEQEKALAQQLQASQQELQLQAQQHGFELSTQRDEQQRLVAACAAIEVQLKAEMQSEQQTALLLRQSLAEVQQCLAKTHASVTWRMTAPLRALAVLISTKKPQTTLPTSLIEGLSHLGATSSSQPIQVNQPLSLEQASAVFPQVLTNADVLFTLNTKDVNMIAQANSIDELLALNDQQFIKCAYRTLLNREPDVEGMNYYLSRFRAGFKKIQIIWQLKNSTEGRSQKVELPGLDIALKKYRQSKLPIVGWWVRKFDASEGYSGVEKKLRIIENQIYLLRGESNNRFDKIELMLSKALNIAGQVNNLNATADKSVFEQHFSTPDSMQHHEPDSLKNLSLRAKEIYSKLRTEMSFHINEGK